MKYPVFIFAVICALGLTGCQKTISGTQLYSFPEPTGHISCTFTSQGQDIKYEIGAVEYDPTDLSTIPLIAWFYNLNLIKCEVDAVEGAECYSFAVGGVPAFSYEVRGSEAYVVIDGEYYRVNNPSTPPVG